MFREQTADAAHPVNNRDAIAEANHRIANSLGLVAALARQQVTALSGDGPVLTRREAQAMIGSLAVRIDAVGRLHRMLSDSQSPDPIDTGSYLQLVASEVVAAMAKKGDVILHFACQLGCRVPAERAMHLGLMVVELVVNSVKHAHPAGIPGKIEIRCRRDPHAIVIDVSDDGVGLPENFDPDNRGHSGMRLIDSLARQIGASVRFHNGSLGLRCEITAPVAAPLAGDAADRPAIAAV
jgi:two-component sensor histidine kinase